ncbi:HIT family protein [Georgenia sp. AZ-5]|uniref:HIT family protein n=1 Tax=Georgenia sp. AZ-5 TaxID=3367526 RepID=UPI0037544AB7
MSAPGCVFCGIVAGTEPGSVVHTEDDVVAFLTTAPINPGHVLVVPRAHAVGLDDLSAATGEALWRLTHRVAVALRRDPAWSEGVNLHLSDGAAAGQHVFHLHMHVIPRFSGDGLRVIDDRPERPPRAALDDVATRLREVLAAEGRARGAARRRRSPST